MTFFVLAGHPYWRHLEPRIMPICEFWLVKWRDFLNVKQDACFMSEVEAIEFAAKLKEPPLSVDDDEALCWGREALAEADRYWREIDRRPRQRQARWRC